MSLTWDNSLEVGVQKIDDQHREIFRHFEKLSSACQEGQGEEALDEVLKFLDDYVAHHFSSEEALMEQHRYPKLPEQREQHAIFRQVIEELRGRSREDGQAHELSLAIDRQLVRWLIQHIRSFDRQMAEYISTRPA
jgi:hemerythrin